MSARELALGLMLLAAPGCVVDGVYTVRGRVLGGVEQAPLAGATVSVPKCPVVGPSGADQVTGPRGELTAVATTNAKGEYTVRCWHGGMLLPFWCVGCGPPDTTVEFAAEGHEPRSARLLGKESDARLARRSCERGCFEFDATPERAGGR